MSDRRRVLMLTHTGRPQARLAAASAAAQFMAAGVEVCAPADEALDLAIDGVTAVESVSGAAAGCELVLVLGGDGTLLRGAELARGSEAALLGVNLGHVGFLADAEESDLEQVVARLVAHEYVVEERLTLDVRVLRDGATVARTWAVNEVSVEKASRERMLEVIVEVDGRPLSRWGCDGVLVATPTGSTAYAFSAGGPVVWPQVSAMLVVPISAHALFARPLVVSPDAVVAVELAALGAGVLWGDGRRPVELAPGDRVEARAGTEPLRLARVHRRPFTDTLVAKFDLPVSGWRGGRRREGDPG